MEKVFDESGQVEEKKRIRYESNPFMQNLTKQVLKKTNIQTRKTEIRSLKAENKALVMGFSGEIDESAALYVQHNAVEKKQFVKLFGAGIALMNDLDKSSTKLFIEILTYVQNNKGTDLIFINQSKTSLSRPTFYKAINQLIEKKLIALGEAPGMYWLNPIFLWNGNRLRFVQEFVKEESLNKQIEMQLGDDQLDEKGL